MADGDQPDQHTAALLARAMALPRELAVLGESDRDLARSMVRALRAALDLEFPPDLHISAPRQISAADRAIQTSSVVLEQSAPSSGTVFKRDAHARILYGEKRGIDPYVAELTILCWLDVHAQRKWTKESLFDQLSTFCDIGTKGSFFTRLNNMRNAETVLWEGGRHRQPIKLGPNGAARLSALMRPGGHGLSHEQYACLAHHVPALNLPALDPSA